MKESIVLEGTTREQLAKEIDSFLTVEQRDLCYVSFSHAFDTYSDEDGDIASEPSYSALIIYEDK